jgi:hypothetical protein
VADDVTLNSMTGGPVVATDDSGTGHVQLVKLAYSADGSRTHVDADTDGLKVKLSNATVTVALSGGSLPTGSNVIGAVTQSGTWNIGSITTLPSLPAGSNVIGGVTQSGSWTVTANAGTGTMAVIERGATIASTSASVTTTSGQIVASSATRRTIVLTNLGSDYVWIGASGVTDNQGIRLAPGQALTIDRSPTAAVHAKAASGTQTVAIFTESD